MLLHCAQAGEAEIKPNACPNCSSKGPFIVSPGLHLLAGSQALHKSLC